MTMTPDVARLNEVVAGLIALHARRAARAPQPPPVPQFRTMATGEVMDQNGQIVYRPRVPRKVPQA